MPDPGRYGCHDPALLTASNLIWWFFSTFLLVCFTSIGKFKRNTLRILLFLTLTSDRLYSRLLFRHPTIAVSEFYCETVHRDKIQIRPRMVRKEENGPSLIKFFRMICLHRPCRRSIRGLFPLSLGGRFETSSSDLLHVLVPSVFASGSNHHLI